MDVGLYRSARKGNCSGRFFRQIGKKGIVVLSDLYAASDRLGGEHLHIAGNHLDARALYSFAVGVLALREPTLEIHFGAFVQVALADLGKLPPDHYVEPFGLLDLLPARGGIRTVDS